MSIEADIVDFCNAIEAAAVNLKHRIGERHGVEAVAEYNPESIPWTKLEGPKGPYQRYPNQGQPEQTHDYLALIADLKAHNGKLQRGGLFYWSFGDDNVTIGRKPAKR